MKKKSSFLVFTLLAINLFQGQAIGINTEEPVSTLEIKPRKTDATTAEGIIAPNLTREQLVSKNAAYNRTHQGAIVYVTDLSGTATGIASNVNSIGYYYFDGTAWQSIGSGSWQIQDSTVKSTINTDNIYQMGKVATGTNSSTEVGDNQLFVKGKTQITEGATIGSQLTDITQINGIVKIPNLEPQANSRAMVIDVNTNIVGTAAAVPALILFAQKRQNQYITGNQLTALNSGTPILIKWNTSAVAPEGDQDFTDEPSDIVTNNLEITLDEATGIFTFHNEKKQQFEISGYVNYIPRATDGNAAALNIIVQIKKNGETDWRPFTGARVVFPNSLFAQTCVYSPAATWFEKGDQVRLVVQRPVGVGSNHGGTDSKTNTRLDAGILRPIGLRYLAGLKIAAL